MPQPVPFPFRDVSFLGNVHQPIRSTAPNCTKFGTAHLERPKAAGLARSGGPRSAGSASTGTPSSPKSFTPSSASAAPQKGIAHE